MNPKPISETETLRTDIEMTRRRMDDTIDALGERMHGRHLLDEVIGFFRHNSDKTAQTSAKVREKVSETAGQISESAGNAANAVVNTVKKNPVPVLLIAAGAAWLAYSTTRSRSVGMENDEIEDDDRYDPDTHYDRPLEYPSGATFSEADTTGSVQSATDEAGSKLGQVTDQVKGKLSDLSAKASDKLQSVKSRASEIGSKVRDRASQIGGQVQDKTREVYTKSRDVVVQTADQRPVEVGLGCLLAGVLVGLAVPTPAPVHRTVGPTMDRLRNRTKQAGRDAVQRGKRVVDAATNAARDEAQSQGLTPDRMREGVQSVASRAGDAASNAAKQEGTGLANDIAPGNQRAGSDPADPSAARPAF
jgi:ElaB/YqjD/DUF883 family membrane-anchored ribosome-binding protein